MTTGRINQVTTEIATKDTTKNAGISWNTHRPTHQALRHSRGGQADQERVLWCVLFGIGLLRWGLMGTSEIVFEDAEHWDVRYFELAGLYPAHPLFSRRKREGAGHRRCHCFRGPVQHFSYTANDADSGHHSQLWEGRSGRGHREL